MWRWRWGVELLVNFLYHQIHLIIIHNGDVFHWNITTFIFKSNQPDLCRSYTTSWCFLSLLYCVSSQNCGSLCLRPPHTAKECWWGVQHLERHEVQCSSNGALLSWNLWVELRDRLAHHLSDADEREYFLRWVGVDIRWCSACSDIHRNSLLLICRWCGLNLP